MEFATRRLYFNRCKPNEALSPGDPRYVPIDDLGGLTHPVRGEDWVAKLAGRVELSEGFVCELLTGLPGSGKSTELRRLSERFADPKRANLFSVVIDAEHTFDLANPIDIPDIILAIVYGVDRALLDSEGKTREEAAAESYPRRFWNWITRTDVELGKLDLAVADPAKLVAELKTRPSLRARVRKTVATHLSTFLDEAKDELTLMQHRATDLGRAGIVVIFDSLEKLRGISTNYEEVLQSAERVFSSGAPYLRLPIHTLYTIPTALTGRSRFEQVQFMPMLKLHTRHGARFETGFDAARQILTRRVPPDVLAQIFGEAELEARLRRIIEWSGGYPRELVRLLQSSIEAETHPLSESQLARILNNVGDQYRKLIPASAFPWLARVSVEKYLTREDDSQRQTAESMLSNNVILRYLNDQEWFDLHPAVRAIPGVDAEIKKLGAEAQRSE